MVCDSIGYAWIVLASEIQRSRCRSRQIGAVTKTRPEKGRRQRQHESRQLHHRGLCKLTTRPIIINTPVVRVYMQRPGFGVKKHQFSGEYDCCGFSDYPPESQTPPVDPELALS